MEKMTMRSLSNIVRLAGAAVVLCGGAAAYAQPYSITWYTIDGGGGTSSGGAYTVSGTIGQPDAGTLSGGVYTLAGGFWAGVTGPTLPACLADVASDGLDEAFNPNGSVGSEDLDAFIAGFIAENVAIADVASDGLDTTRNPNGSVGSEDLDAFIAAFILGC